MCKFILAEKHLFEVDGRRAGAVAIKIRASSSKQTIAQNDARHRLNEKQAQARRAPVKFSWQEQEQELDKRQLRELLRTLRIIFLQKLPAQSQAHRQWLPLAQLRL